jgi:hypothetical protein
MFFKKKGDYMRVVDEFLISDNTKLRLQVGEYRGSERIDLRQYIKGVDDEFSPTKKGVNFNAEWLPDFIAMVKKLENE